MRTNSKTIIDGVTMASDYTSAAQAMRHYRHVAIQVVTSALDADDTGIYVEGSLDGSSWDVMQTHYLFGTDTPSLNTTVDANIADAYYSPDGYEVSGTGNHIEIFQMDNFVPTHIRVRYSSGSATTGTLTVKIVFMN